MDSPGGTARQNDIIAVTEVEMSIVAEQLAVTVMDKQQLVTITVAHQMVHTGGDSPEPQLQRVVAQNHAGGPRRVAGLG
jgi:hypothetical protein